MNIYDKADKAVILLGFAHFKVLALTIAMGTTFGLVMIAVCAILILQGDSAYTVINNGWTFVLLTTVYAFFVGAIVGFCIAIAWNLSHIIYVALVVIRANWWKLMAE